MFSKRNIINKNNNNNNNISNNNNNVNVNNGLYDSNDLLIGKDDYTLFSNNINNLHAMMDNNNSKQQ